MSVAGLDPVSRFVAHGAQRYGETVTQLQHALQCADLARRDRAADEVVLAALLHDVGHLPAAGTAGLLETGEHHHGSLGALLIVPFVRPRMVWLIERHVVAKRYLYTVDARYGDRPFAGLAAVPRVAGGPPPG